MRYSIDCFEDYEVIKLVYVNLLTARAIANERKFEELVERLDKVIKPFEDDVDMYESSDMVKTTAPYKPY